MFAGGVYFGRADHDLWRTCAAALDPRAELDGAPPIDAADEAVLIEHIGHACGVTVPARRATWGTVKTIHR